MEFLANPDLKNVAQGATPTGSTKVAVLEGANNTIKYRSVDDIVSAGGGTTSPNRADLLFSNASEAQQPSIPASTDPVLIYPFLGDTYPCKYKINFVPNNYQIVIVMYTEIDSAVVTSPVGLNLEYSTNDSTWTDVTNWDLRDIDGWTSTSGSLSIGSASNVWFRFRSYNAGYIYSVNFNHFNLCLSVWK